MSEEIIVQQIHDLPTGIEDLVRASLSEDFAFVERLANDWSTGENRFDGRGEALFAAFLSSRLGGVCGLNQDPFSPDPSIGRLRRLYVHPSARKRGVATALTRAALSAARGQFSVVRLRTLHSEASAFYRTLGFSQVCGDANVTHEIRL
jgi:GNAT superfamily N-acetyltransferase